MPPRRMPGSSSGEGQEVPADATTRVLESVAQLLAQQAANGGRNQAVSIYDQFRRMNPQDFSGSTDPLVAEGWIKSLEVIFRYMNMADADRIRCAIFHLKGDALLWWEGAERGTNLNTLSWDEFKRIFYEKYFTADVRSRLQREFMSLRQGDMTVAEFVRKFDRGCCFMPLIAGDAGEKLRHFLHGLRPTVRRDVMLSHPTNYGVAVTEALRAEQNLKDIEWEMSRKRPQQQQQQQQGKKPYTGPQRPQGQQRNQGPPRFQGQQKQQPPRLMAPKTVEKPLCNECGRNHFGKCLFGTGKCFKCGGEHLVDDCPQKRQPMTGRAFVMHAEEAEPDTTLITGILNISAFLHCLFA